MHVIFWSQYQGPRGWPETMYFLPNLYDRRSYAIEIDSIKIEEFYPSITVDLSESPPKFEDFAQGVLNSNNSIDLFEDANGTLELSLFLLSKIEEYSRNNLRSHY